MKISKAAMAGVYVVIAILLGVLLGHFNIPTYWRLLRFGRPEHAVVVRTNCGNHGSVFYRFEVEGREYRGVGNAGFGTSECDQLKTGDQIIIYYLPRSPEVNRPGEIRDRWSNELIFLGLSVVVAPGVLVYVLWRALAVRYRMR